ncbi:permease [Clostridium acetobutylicum]|nr:permease [Clostridium acetobutylicum]
MNILTKFITKSILEKKSRAFLIIFSILISTTLLVASLGISDSITTNYRNLLKGSYEDFNVVINSNEKAQTPFFTLSNIHFSNIKNNFKTCEVSGYLKNNDNEQFNMLGTSLNDFKKFKNIRLLKSKNLEPFTGNKLIISESISNKLNLKLGSKITLNTLGKENEYIISAIASNNSLFLSDSKEKFTLVTPTETACSIYGKNVGYTNLYTSIDKSNVNNWIKKFNTTNPNLSAKVLLDDSNLESQLNTIKTCLLFMLCIVLIMSTLIIYSSFKLIVLERIPLIGTLLSQGATKLSIIIIFFKESFIYGFLGGLIGDILGCSILYLTAALSNPLKNQGIAAKFNLNYIYLLYGFIFSVTISVISSLIPILSIRKFPVKEIILNNFVSTKVSYKKSFIVGTFLIFLSIASHFTGENLGSLRPYIMSLPAFFMCFLGIILIIPGITILVTLPFIKLSKNRNVLPMLALNNIRTSKVLLNNIRLISISLMTIMMVMSMTNSLKDTLTEVYKNLNFDVSIDVDSQNVDVLKKCSEIINNYDKKTNVIRRKYIDTNLNNDFSKKIDLLCVDPNNFKSYDNYLVYTNKNKQLDQLNNNEDGIIISEKNSRRYNLKKGDTISLYSSNSEKEDFKILSVVNAGFMNMGNINLISFKAALKHFNVRYSNEFFISTSSNTSNIKKDLIKKFKGFPVSVSTKQDNVNKDAASSKEFISLFNIFSFTSMLIALLGILSNISISFVQRKKEIASLISIGLSSTGKNLMILFESFTEGLIAFFITFLSSIWTLTLLSDIFKYLVLNINLTYPFSFMPWAALSVSIIMFIASLKTLLRSKKLNIIHELKYE